MLAEETEIKKINLVSQRSLSNEDEKKGFDCKDKDKHQMQEDSGKGIFLTQSTFEQSLKTSQGNPQLNSGQ